MSVRPPNASVEQSVLSNYPDASRDQLSQSALQSAEHSMLAAGDQPVGEASMIGKSGLVSQDQLVAEVFNQTLDIRYCWRARPRASLW